MKRFKLNLNLTSVIVIIAVGVLLPVMLSAVAGIVAIVLAKNAGAIITGALIISFTVAALGSGLVALVFASKKARLARLQSDFIANISHELKTPLSAIKLYAQTLQSEKLADDPERTAKCVATILRETEWLDLMIDKVLTWRASSKDILTLNMEILPVSQTITDAIERFRSMVEPEDLILTSSINSNLLVKHDTKTLNAMLLNLLTNAYKYTDEKKEIHVSAKDDNDNVIIEVKDNGTGLTPAETKHIFEPFYRASQEKSGMGLGLAIAHYLVDCHKGTISVNSEKDKGTTFVISLPAVRETA